MVKKSSAYTVIELVAVIAIMGVIATIVVSALTEVIRNVRAGEDMSRATQSARSILQAIIKDVRSASGFSAIAANEFEVTLTTGEAIRFRAQLLDVGSSTYEVRRIVNNAGSGDLIGTKIAKFGNTPGLAFEFYDAESNVTSQASSATTVLATITLQLDKGNTTKFASGVGLAPCPIGPVARRP